MFREKTEDKQINHQKGIKQMQNLYPLFERNRILKKELLWSLRDYSFAHIQLEYQEYEQGILRGCNLRVEEKELVVGKGILKFKDFVCLLTEEQRIPYTSVDQIQYLKISVDIDKNSQDYIAYQMKIFLTIMEEKKGNEFELCRFHLRNGAKLRDSYKDFTDMETEYDTVNLIYSDWAGLGGKTMNPVITRYFAKLLLESEGSDLEDRAFAYLCLSKSGAIPIKPLMSYINRRSGRIMEEKLNNLLLYQYLNQIINESQKGVKQDTGSKKERRKILVD